MALRYSPNVSRALNRCMLLTPLTIVTLLAAISTFGQGAQDLCRNNRNSLAELQKQMAVVNRDLAYTADDEERNRDYLGKINKGIVDPGRRDEGKPAAKILATPEGRRITAKALGVQWRPEYDKDDVLLLKALRDAEVKRIERIKYVLTHVDELKQQKAAIDQKIAFHENRLRELRCGSEKSDDSEGYSGPNVSGTWSSECCGNHYSADFTFVQQGSKITGYVGNASNGTTGDISGEITGSAVKFKRKWSDHEQEYTLTLSSDGKTLTGSFTGFHDPKYDTQFTAKRK